MKNKFTSALAVIALLFLFGEHAKTFAQTTINTTVGSTGYTGNNSSSYGITFVINNTSANAIILTDVGDWCSSAQNNATFTLYYSSTSLSGTPATTFPATGWTQIASNSPTGLSASLGVNNVITGMNFIIPGNTMYRFSLVTTSTRYYSGTGPATCSPNTFTQGGVSLYVGDYQIGGNYVGYGYTNNPRFFTGSITFMPATPCSGQPTAGNITGTINDTLWVCKSTPFMVIDTGATLAANITYQWQQKTGAGAWTNVTGGTSTTLNNSGVTSPIDYRLIVKCTSSGLSDTTSPITVALKPALECYCIPTTNYGCSVANINWFNLKGDGSTAIKNDNSGCSPAEYGNFTNKSARVRPLLTYKGTIGTSYSGPTYVNIRGWIDYNDDGVFSASEQFYAKDGYSDYTKPEAFTMTIPPNANPGSHRLRIRSTYSSPAASSIDPCNIVDYGETEDYTIIVDSIPACAGQPNAGAIDTTATFWVCKGEAFGVMDTGGTVAKNMTYQWQQRSPAGTGTWSNVPSSQGGNTFNLNITGGINNAVDYRFIVKCNTSGLADTTSMVTAKLNAPTDCYCKANNFYTSSYPLDEVETYGAPQNIRNVGSGFSPNGYGNFRNDTLILYRGIDFVLRMVAPLYTNYYGAWIDWNQNGSFTDAGENVSNSNATVGAPWIDTIAVPATATIGTTGMRVRSSYIYALSPCGNDDYGETEDYTVSIEVPSCQFPSYKSVTSSNITTTTATISWSAASPAPSGGYEYYISTGATLPVFVTSVNTASGTSASVTGLSPNTRYYVWVRSNCGTNNKSIWTKVHSFVTDCLPQDVPYNAPIAAATTPSIPECMRVENLNTTGKAWYSASGAPGSNYGFSGKYMQSDRATSGAVNSWMFTNKINLQPNTYYKVAFRYGNNSTSTKEKLKVAMGTSAKASSMITTLFNDNNIGLAGSTDTDVYFTVSASGSYVFGFQAYSNVSQGNLFVQNIIIDSMPVCHTASQLLANNVTKTSARLTWFGVGKEFRIEYGLAGFIQGSGTMISTRKGTFDLSGLTPNTKYDFYVKNVCVPGLDSAGWSSKGTFTTKCEYPNIDLGNKDIYFCQGDSAVISTNNKDTLRTVKWSTSATADSIIVRQSGTYKVTVTNRWDCSVSDSVLVDVRSFPIINLGNDTAICSNEKIRFDAGDQQLGATYFWSTTEATRYIETSKAGTYTVIVDNLGCVSEDSIKLEVFPKAMVNGITGTLNPATGKYNFYAIGAKNVDNYYWNFGDGSNATGIYPEHTYQIQGNYTVTLIVSNKNSDRCGQDTVTTLVNYIDRTGIGQVDIDKDAIQLYPNPAKDVVMLKNESRYKMESIIVYNVLGQVVFEGRVDNAKQYRMDVSGLASGVYNVKVNMENGGWVQRRFEIVK